MVDLAWSWAYVGSGPDGVMTVWLGGAPRNLSMPTLAAAQEFAQVLRRALATKFTAGRQSMLDEVLRIKP